MPVTQPSFTTILIRPLQPRLPQLRRRQQPPVILVTTAYFNPTIINDKRPFTPCESRTLKVSWFTMKNNYW
jgi:hypothetical protein